MEANACTHARMRNLGGNRSLHTVSAHLCFGVQERTCSFACTDAQMHIQWVPSLGYYQAITGETTLVVVFPRNKISEAVQITAQLSFCKRLFGKKYL
jgi:hypothetical protein